MTVLFKNLPTRFAEDLTQRGSIRITTLKICRGTEAIAGAGRSDPWDATVLNEIRVGRLRHIPEGTTAAEIADLRRRGYVTAAEARLPASPIPNMIRVDILGDFNQTDDKYLFCVSARPTTKLERRFASGEPDSWVEIFDWERFCAVLNGHMLSLGHSPYGCRPVDYRSGSFVRRGESADPAFVKRLSGFGVEHETRVVWTPGRLPIDAIYPELSELTKYCRILRHITRR